MRTKGLTYLTLLTECKVWNGCSTSLLLVKLIFTGTSKYFILLSLSQFDETTATNKSPGNENIATLPRFRVTCTRTGNNHSFSSPEAAAKFGGGINDFFGWRVDLSNPDIEVLLNIVNSNVVVGIALTKESRGKRNISHFGPTTLKSSIAYCMLQLANIQAGRS